MSKCHFKNGLLNACRKSSDLALPSGSRPAGHDASCPDLKRHSHQIHWNPPGVQALMAAPWPKALLHHPLMAQMTLAGISEQVQTSVRIPAMYFAEDAGQLSRRLDVHLSEAELGIVVWPVA